MLQRPAGAVGQLTDVAVEARLALLRRPGGLVDFRECGEARIVGGRGCPLLARALVGHDAPTRLETGSVNIRCGTSISRSRPSRDWKRTVVDCVTPVGAGCLSAQDHNTIT